MFKKGDKIKYVSATDAQVGWGNNTDPRGILEVDRVYEVESVEVHSYHTKIRLVGIEGKFNSAHFDIVKS